MYFSPRIFKKHWAAVFHLVFSSAKVERLVKKNVEDLKGFISKSALQFRIIMRPQEKADAVAKAVQVVKSFQQHGTSVNYSSIVDQTVGKLEVGFKNKVVKIYYNYCEHRVTSVGR